MNIRNERSNSALMTCPVCGKEFLCYNMREWAYKTKTSCKNYTFCSWTCKRRYERMEEHKEAEIIEKVKHSHRHRQSISE